jgi:hypothetical protein
VIRVEVPDVAAVVGDLESDMRAANRALGRDLGRVVTKAQNDAIRASGRGTLSGMRVKLAATAKAFAGADRVTVDVTATPAGPWSIREHGRAKVRAHGRALGIPGYPRRSARSARGRPLWDATVDAAEPAIAAAVAKVYDEALT